MPKLDALQVRQLDEQGFLLFEGVLAAAEVAALRAHLEQLWQAEGEAASSENYVESGARRLANLANKGDIFRPIYGHPLILAAIRQVVGPAVCLSMLNARDALPGSGAGQPFHADTDGGALPDEQGYFAATAVWLLDPFTVDNGGTRLVPGSHRSGQVPRQGMADIFATHPDEIAVTGRPGDVLVFNGHLWHAGGENKSDHPRRAILAHYFRADIPRRHDRQQHLDEAVRGRLTTDELTLLGLA